MEQVFTYVWGVDGENHLELFVDDEGDCTYWMLRVETSETEGPVKVTDSQACLIMAMVKEQG